MLLFCPKESAPETRVAVTPETAGKFTSLGIQVIIEAGAGANADYPDTLYTTSGAAISTNPSADLARADVVLRVRKPAPTDLALLKQGCLHISFLDPFNQPELLQAAASAGVNTISIEMMPRTTLAQKMDALSSQANLAGYFAIIRAAERINRILPMMMTPAGTISPAKVFVIGVGVAGLQAIATAKRLGARVEAFDTRPVVEEQVRSLGAKFVKIDIGETGQTEQGYARELTAEQIEKQRLGMAKVCAQSDIVVTTAKLFGRKAPTLVTQAMLDGMKPGSIVVDLATESGGNVEGSQPDQEITTANGVRIIGTRALEACVPFHSSQVYAANLLALIEHFWDKTNRTFEYRLSDEILQGCLLTHNNSIIHPRFNK